MNNISREDDGERWEQERLTRIEIGSLAQRMVRDADQAQRSAGLPDDVISVRDAALHNACTEIYARDATLREARAQSVKNED